MLLSAPSFRIENCQQLAAAEMPAPLLRLMPHLNRSLFIAELTSSTWPVT